jgi:predicted PurR-regulated permease PerM
MPFPKDRLTSDPAGRLAHFQPSRDPLDNPLRTAGGALMNWWRAVTLDALIVGVLWLLGLELLHVPLAPLWAALAAVFQFIPAFGPMLALIGPVLSVAFGEEGDTFFHIAMVLGLYAVIAALEGLVIGPYVLHRTTRVPWWAALLGPIVLGILIPPWGVLIAPPLLAVIYAFRRPAPPPV